MLISTTNTVEGFEIHDYLGPVFSETILSANVFRDLFAEVVNFLGGRAKGYEKEMRKTRRDVLEKLLDQARELEASGIIGVRIDYEFLPVGRRGGMLMVAAQGTAVRLVKIESESKEETKLTSIKIGG